jgi:hypothetical protein
MICCAVVSQSCCADKRGRSSHRYQPCSEQPQGQVGVVLGRGASGQASNHTPPRQVRTRLMRLRRSTTAARLVNRALVLCWHADTDGVVHQTDWQWDLA